MPKLSIFSLQLSLFLLLVALPVYLANATSSLQSEENANDLIAAQHEVLEISWQSTRAYANPYQEITLDVRFTSANGQERMVPAFWAGGDLWKVRFSASDTGTYTFASICSDRKNRGLHEQKGKVQIVPYDGTNILLRHGPLQINDQNIVHADQTPFLWLADSWWHGMTTRFRWPEDFQQLTQERKNKGFSVIQFALGFPCDIYEFDSRGANENGFPVSRDYTQINPAYFDLTDQRIEYLVENGLVPNILGTWGYYLPWFGIENMQRYWRYIIARYGAYPVTWTLAGETTLIYYLTEDSLREERKAYQREGWSKVAQYIQQTDPYNRILSAHPGPSSGNFQAIEDMTLLDLVMVQPGHQGWQTLPRALDHLHTAQTRFPDRPVMQGEVCFEGMMGGGSDPKLQRILFWTNMMSGASGHCYGADAIWQFNTEEELFGASPGGHTWGNTPWEEAHQWKGSYYVGLGRKILQQYPWQHLEPQTDFVSPHASAENRMHAYALGNDSLRLVYFPHYTPWGQQYELLRLDPEATYQATFVDPMNGERHPVDNLITGSNSWQASAAPTMQDWLLELKQVDATPDHPRAVNPEASPETQKLLDYLYSIQGKHTLSGQHNYPGTISAYTDEAFTTTGRFPVVWGQDFGFTADGKDGINHRKAIIQEAIKKDKQGYIITLMWHAVRPIDDEPSGWKSSVQNELTDEEWKALVTPGTALHQRWLRQLDVVAEHLKVLRDAKIPVLWRPYHEMNGEWFWWGDKKGEQGYQALWRNMYQYFTGHHQLNNLVWVWNANALVNPKIGDYHAYFPGPELVDIVATDFYGGNYQLEDYYKLLELADGKPIAIGECGELPSPEILQEQPRWTWFMTWAGYLQKNNRSDAVQRLFDSQQVLHRKDVQWRYE